MRVSRISGVLSSLILMGWVSWAVAWPPILRKSHLLLTANLEDCAKTRCLLLKTEGHGNTGSSPCRQLVRAVCVLSSSGGRTHHSLWSEIPATVLPQVVDATLWESAGLEYFFKQQSFHLWRRFAHIGKEYFFSCFFFKFLLLYCLY